MKLYDNIALAADETREWIILNQADLTESLISLTRTGVSPVDLIVKFAETVYANEESFTDVEALEIAAADAALCEEFGYHGMNIDARGSKIASVLRGNTVENPPEPKPEFIFTA
jgi:hypothetical protein